VICTLKGPVSPQIEKKLVSLNIIRQLRIDNNKIYFYTDNVNEVTPIIVKELVKLDAKILEINRTVRTLEDIYLKQIEKD